MKNLNSTYQCISPLFYFSKIFSLAPFCLPSQNGVLKTSVVDYIIFVLCQVYFSFILYLTIDFHFVSSESDSIVVNICATVAVLWLMCLSFISIFLAMFRRNFFFQLLKLFNECDQQVFLKCNLFTYF